MLLYFPSPDTLRLALTSGILPEAVRTSPTRFGFEGKAVWVESSAKLSEKVESGLRRLGVQFSSDSTIHLPHETTNWLQIFPLECDAVAVEVGDKTPVLFELTQEGQLAELAIEILRLGNSRQSFRWLEAGSCPPLPPGEGPGVRGLLRVIGPPYYSLLRALDQDGAALAYREMAPRVWVQVGYTHPLAEHLKPLAGQLLLIREPRQWSYIPEAAWTDIYEVIDFQLADAVSIWHDVVLTRIQVPVKLTRAGSAEAAELWLLRDDGIAQLEELVRSSDNELLARLAFAVGEKDGHRVVVLRARPSKNQPPVFVLNGLAFRSYLRIPNLFLPIGTILHPPLRRDAVIKLLAEDRTRLVWLLPSGSAFTPESVSDDAFRPLNEWIDYVLEYEHQAIKVWLGATQFQFEGFLCKDDAIPEKKPPKAPKPPKKPEPLEPAENLQVVEKQYPKQEEPIAEVTSVAPTELEHRLRELEDRYNVLKTPLEDTARQALWREMAQVNGALNQPSDAAICWSNALWEESRVNADGPREWLQAECKQPIGTAQILRIVGSDTPSHGNLRLVAAYLIWASTSKTPLAELSKIQQFLLKHESYLGVRTLWLAWHSLHQLAGGDLLTLARARDRLLERLHVHGLTPELDLPGFLRFTGLQANNRFRAVRAQVVRLRRLVQDWANLGSMPVPETHAYIDLVFAFGLARLGEINEARKLLREAGQTLAHADEVHSWLYQAFEFRIQQALDGKTTFERLPTSLLQRLEAIEKPDYLKLGDPGEEVKRGLRHLRLIIERMQSKSRILEPLERLDAYRRTFSARHDELHRELIGLSDLHDREELIERFTQLFNGKRKLKGSTRTDPRILIAALDLAPRLGQAFGEETLDRVPEALYTEICANEDQWREWESLQDHPAEPQTSLLASQQKSSWRR